MLQKYSWSEYWTVVVVGIAIYYVIVLLILYRNGLLQKPSFKKPAPAPPRPAKQVPVKEAEPKPKPTALSAEKELELQLMSLIDDVTNFLRDIAGKSYVKEEIIMGLQVFMRDYKDFANTIHQPQINEFILAEVDNYCSVDLTDEEVSRVWMG